MKRSSFIYIAILFIICLLVITSIVFILVHKKHEQAAVNTQQPSIEDQFAKLSPVEQELLGRWNVFYSNDATSSDTYWGFTVTSQGNVVREYYGLSDDPQPQPVVSGLFKWRVINSNNQNIVQEFSWDDTTFDSPTEEYVIASSSPDSLTLTSREFTSGSLILKKVLSGEQEAQVSFERTPKQLEEACNYIFGADANDVSEFPPPVLLPITCKTTLGPDNTTYDFTIAENGDVNISNGSTTLFSHVNDYGMTFFDGPLYTSGISLEDITYDGWKDIAVQTSAGAYNFFYDYYAYNPTTKKFDPDPILTNIVNPSVDLKNKTVTSYDKGRGIGDVFEEDTYQFQNGNYVLIQTESQDFVGDDESLSAPHHHVIRKLIHGDWATTTDEIIGVDQP